jgi:anti-sigma B factor antagonist
MASSDSLCQISSLDGGVTYVQLSGDVDLAVELELREELSELVNDGHKRVVVDLTDVSFIDSAGLAVLLHISGKLRRGRGLAVVCPNESMRGLFELVGLNLLFPIDDTLEDALRHVKPRRRFAPRSREPKEEPHRS